MQTTPASRAALWNPPTLIAIGFALAAVAAAFGAYLSVARAQRLADAVMDQRSITLAYESRALVCLDHASAWLDDPAEVMRAERSLNMSGGITLCLVGAREDARVDAKTLDACIRRLELANMVPARSGAPFARPVC